MEGSLGAQTDDLHSRGYTRESVDEFVAASRVMQEELEEQIRHDEHRIRRARAAVDADQTMVAMLLEAQREIDIIRAQAESEAAMILSRTEPRADTASASHEDLGSPSAVASVMPGAANSQ